MIVTITKPSTRFSISQNGGAKVSITKPNSLIKVFAGSGVPKNPSAILTPYIAGENIGGQRAVVTDANGNVVAGDQTNLSHLGLFTGITRTSVVTGEIVDVISYGKMTDSSFSLTPESKIYLGTAGLVTETAPTTGFLQSIGHVIKSDTIFINPQIPTELN